ncbi:alpha/beta hydrolase [Falsiroseomonas sp. CW058]|uniref:alpha/beta hydrolase n=1 Tax=Falsiroseomonas sp. CW058 TaxID=3388664 RepID=UPI003D310AD5
MARRLALLLPGLLAACSPARVAGLLTPSGGSETREGLAYGPHPRLRLDLTLPAGVTAATPLVVFIYGGSWRMGERADYAFVARALAARGIAVAVPDYRLWPEARWPDFIEDAATATAWLRSGAGRAAGAPSGPVFVMGHSAGGFIAAALALDPRWLGAAGLPGGRDALAGGALLAAPIAWQPTDEPVRSIFAPAPGGRIEAVPDPAMLAGAPPLLLLHGADDVTVGPFHSVRLAAAMEAAGRPARLRVYDGVAHVGILAAMAGPVRALGLARADALEEVAGFVRARA